MTEIFPYQIVAFLEGQPEVGESAYNSPRGWFPQIALKRRFIIKNESEQKIIELVEQFCDTQSPFTISVGELTKPERMPVRVIEVARSDELMNFHSNLIQALGENLLSRYPEREEENYLPHITAEYNGKFVINPGKYRNREYTISQVCLLKDSDGEDSLAYQYFTLRRSYKNE